MMVYAYVYCGISVEEFWDMSYYEFGLASLKSRHNFETKAAFNRDILCLLANINRDDKRKPSPFKGSDFYKLSFDKDEVEELKLLTPEEVENKFPKTLKK